MLYSGTKGEAGIQLLKMMDVNGDEDTGELEMKCWSTLIKIKDAKVLEEIYNKLEIQIPPGHVGKAKLLFKFLLRKLNSEDVQNSEDKGLGWFLKLWDVLSEGVDVPPRAGIKGEPDGETVNSVLDIGRMKELKINGRIGGIGEKDRISYVSLSYQIGNAKKMGYSEEIICSSVIKAITPESHLRTYLESKHSLTLSSLIEVMRSHFREKDSTSIFSELSNAVQAANESCLDFIIRAMCLREKVISLSVEGCAYDSHLVNQRFSHTILTGLRNNNIRNELRIFLKNKHVVDEELLKVVTEAVANETEHSEKTEKRNIVKINTLEYTGKQIKEKELPLPQQIKEMKVAQERELSAMRDELHEIKSLLHAATMNNYSDSRRFPQQRRKTMRRKCQVCYANGAVSCFHCFQCGSGDHRVANCPSVNNSGN